MNSPCKECVVYAMCEELCDKAKNNSDSADEYFIEIYNRQNAKSYKIANVFLEMVEKITDSILAGKKL